MGRFLKIEANQIIASNANFDEAVAKKLWSQIVTAKEGVFDKIKANMLAVGALDGQIITGATVADGRGGRGRVILDSNGLRLVSADGSTDKFRIKRLHWRHRHHRPPHVEGRVVLRPVVGHLNNRPCGPRSVWHGAGL